MKWKLVLLVLLILVGVGLGADKKAPKRHPKKSIPACERTSDNYAHSGWEYFSSLDSDKRSSIESDAWLCMASSSDPADLASAVFVIADTSKADGHELGLQEGVKNSETAYKSVKAAEFSIGSETGNREWFVSRYNKLNQDYSELAVKFNALSQQAQTLASTLYSQQQLRDAQPRLWQKMVLGFAEGMKNYQPQQIVIVQPRANLNCTSNTYYGTTYTNCY